MCQVIKFAFVICLVFVTFSSGEIELNQIIGAHKGDSTLCDFSACNGMEYEANGIMLEGENTIIGECSTPFGTDKSGDDLFCFVNADSNCPDKKESSVSGTYISVQACADFPRLSKSWSGFFSWFTKIVGAFRTFFV